MCATGNDEYSDAGANPAAASSVRIGDVSAMLRTVQPLHGWNRSSLDKKRQMLASWFRLLGEAVTGKEAAVPQRPTSSAPSPMLDAASEPLPPRLAQTLSHLLAGQSEKEVARDLHLSRHTVHVYVKTLYRRFNVTSRAELLALHLRR